MNAYQKHVCYNGPVEIKEYLAKEDKCITQSAVHTGREGSSKQKWWTDEKTHGTYHRIYATVTRS
jgi:hypothetical protein